MSGVLDNSIIQVVKKTQRDVQRGVLPWMVQARLDVDLHEKTVRSHMRRMWQEGKLERVGGANARRGYKVAA